MKENQQQRKDSLITDHNSREALQENEIGDLPQPQLKYMMSMASEPEEIVVCGDLPIQTLQEEIAIQTNPLEKEVPQPRVRRNRKTRVTLPEQLSEVSVDQSKNTTPCNCTKSNCLKLYCLCFHQNIQCTELCKCHECKNCEKHQSIRQNALEKIKLKQQRQKHDDDLFDRSRVWGCRCQKSQCQKNYCECFVRGQKCTSECLCRDCANKKKMPSHFRKKKKVEAKPQSIQN